MLKPGDDLEEWDRFVDQSPQGTLFCKSEWLRNVLEDSFEIAVCRGDGEIRAGLPLPLDRRGRDRSVVHPPIASTMGVLLRPPSPGRKYEKRLSEEMAAIAELVALLPRFRSFSISCHPEFMNWLPFYWAGYQQTTHYTYVLPSIQSREAILEGMDYSKRKNINKAAKEVRIDATATVDELYEHHCRTLKRQGATISYRREYLRRVHDAAGKVGGVIVRRAVGLNGAVHAIILIVYDHKSAYYLVSSIDPEFRNSGSATLLLLQAIEEVRAFTDRFDFEGSMIPGVERSFRKFGARQTPYFSITKGNDLRGQLMKLGERLLRRYGLKE